MENHYGHGVDLPTLLRGLRCHSKALKRDRGGESTIRDHWILFLKEQFTMYICHPPGLKKLNIPSFAQQWILCSEWVPSEWESKQQIKTILSQTCSFWLHRTLTDGLEWCGLFWCLYQLFELSFWRHPFTAEDPLLSKRCNATFLQICSNEQTNYILDGPRLSEFSARFHFW